MPPSDYKRKWIKLWIDECLNGTVREDLTPEERGTWYDFLLFAGRNRPPGNISANEDTPMPARRLAAILNISEGLVNQCIKKFRESGRITVDKKGIISIANWSKYQYTDYDRQKAYQKPEPEIVTADTIDEYLAEIRPEYLDLDIDAEMVKFKLYWSEGKRKLTRPKLALRNWLDKARKIQGTSKPAEESTSGDWEG